MAGAYPDPPGNRMAWDRDGTIVGEVSPTDVLVLENATARQNMNDESFGTAGSTVNTKGGGNPSRMLFLFPEARNITHLHHVTAQTSGSLASLVESSVDTTNGIDGTWLTVGGIATSTPTTSTTPGFRAPVAVSSNGTGIKAIRFSNTSIVNSQALISWHLYGTRAAANPDKLELWHPTLDQALYVTPAFMDFGDVQRSTSSDKQFRIKNRSLGLTANGIIVSREILTDGSPAHLAELTLDFNGSGYGTSQNIGNLAPGAISSLLTLRNTIGASSPIGLVAPRLVAAATSWS